MSPKRKKTTKSDKGEEIVQDTYICPNCGGDLEIYSGENPLKAGTGFCSKDGQRYKLDDATTS